LGRETLPSTQTQFQLRLARQSDEWAARRNLQFGDPTSAVVGNIVKPQAEKVGNQAAVACGN